jgi:phosphoglycerol transferase MdoB-like AlkP superfamily enzyme
MSKAGLLFVSACIGVALLFMIPALRFPGGTVDGTPGPGYFPIIVCSVILFLSAVLFVQYLKDTQRYFQKNDTQKKNLPKLLITAGAVLLYTVLFMVVPFIPLTLVFIMFLNWLFGRTWRFNIIFSLIFTGVIYYVFNNLLHVML